MTRCICPYFRVFFNPKVFNRSRVIFEITTYGSFWPASVAEVNVQMINNLIF